MSYNNKKIIKYLKISSGIFLALAASRFLPHPPNFTSLIALSFYVPAILGRNFIPALIFSFILTDIFIGFHNTVFFTWGSVLLISFLPKFFVGGYIKRILGTLAGVLMFYIITNFGVWITLGFYEYTANGLLLCYTLALPFLGYSLISTILFSTLIETILKIFSKKLNFQFNF